MDRYFVVSQSQNTDSVVMEDSVVMDCGDRKKKATVIGVIVSCGVVVGIICAVYFTVGQTSDTDGQIQPIVFPPDSNDTLERLEDFDNDIICEDGTDSGPGPYLNLSEAQLIFFTTQGTQRQRLNENAEKYTYRPRYTRKELRQLTDQEWENYVQAILATSTTYPGNPVGDPYTKNFSEYQIFLALHNEANSPYAHEGAAFGVWHREYLIRFERTLRSHQSDVTIPYWDSSLDELLPDPTQSIIFSDRFFGGLNGTVTNGRFPNFPSVPACYCIGRTVTRHASEERLLFNEEKFRDLAMKESFRSFIFGDEETKSETCLERYHDRVHVWLGGHMGEVPCAPTDPIFWSHHGFIDLLFEEFRQRQSLNDRLFDYPEDIHVNNQNLTGHGPYEPMIPFEPIVNMQGLSEIYTGILYNYTSRPSLIDCDLHTDCQSRFLWCDNTAKKCVSKVEQNCTGIPSAACFCEDDTTPRCQNDLCYCD